MDTGTPLCVSKEGDAYNIGNEKRFEGRKTFRL